MPRSTDQNPEVRRQLAVLANAIQNIPFRQSRDEEIRTSHKRIMACCALYGLGHGLLGAREARYLYESNGHSLSTLLDAVIHRLGLSLLDGILVKLPDQDRFAPLDDAIIYANDESQSISNESESMLDFMEIGHWLRMTDYRLANRFNQGE